MPSVRKVSYTSAVELVVLGGRSVHNFVEVEGEPSRMHNVYYGGLESGAARFHPTQKPLWLMRELLQVHSKADSVVLDPYCGSGTTLVAARELGRHCIGIEAEEKWVEMATKRLQAVSSMRLEL